jgi:hypothetical protein
MFAYICTYHHILPEFAELVFTFGKDSTDDFTHARFIRGDEGYEGVPELSRSDQQSRFAYKLFAMEVSDFDKEWTMRQTVVYHSLDLSNGRTFWLILKANGLIKDRIKEDNADKRQHPASVSTNTGEALKAAFSNHITVLAWGCEGWRWYITELERLARPNCVKVIAAPIARVETALISMTALAGLTGAANDRRAQIKQAQQWLDIFRTFTLGGPQSLTSVLSKINDAKAAMAMNIRMSEDLRLYYQDMFDCGQLSKTITDSYASAHGHFQRRARSLERLLEMESLRADTLAEKVRTHINLVCLM